MLGWLWSLVLGAVGVIGGVVLLVIFWIVAFLVVGLIATSRGRKTAVRRFRARWVGQGKDLLLVYSNSPNWQAYIEAEWLPRWGHRAVVLNWSQRSNWRRPFPAEVLLFRAFSGV